MVKTKTLSFVVVITLPVLLILFGCSLKHNEDAEILKVMKTWEGSHVSRLIRSWGPPNQKVSDEAGGLIYIYRYNTNALAPISPPKQEPSYSMSQTLNQASNRFIYQERLRQRHKMMAMKKCFYVRSNGTIYWTNIVY